MAARFRLSSARTPTQLTGLSSFAKNPTCGSLLVESVHQGPVLILGSFRHSIINRIIGLYRPKRVSKSRA
jgi:hypothetical protein